MLTLLNKGEVSMKFFGILFTFFLIGCSKKGETIPNPPVVVSAAPSASMTPVLPEPTSSSEMIEIQGNYCTEVKQECVKWMEDPKLFPRARCETFLPSVCIGERRQLHYFIDREEFATNYEGVPVSDISWTQAKALCKANDKRLCSEEEWIFACEGEEMNPYPTGLTRPSELCNMDRTKDLVCGKDLCDHRADIGDHPKCLSVYGVHNMSGNVDEWVEVPIYSHSKIPSLTMRSGLKGGHWLPVRNRCRPITKDHDEHYRQISIGFRCCKDVE
jgi:sulfatase modifying factor 1